MKLKKQILFMSLMTLNILIFTGCGIGNTINSLNPFSSDETDQDKSMVVTPKSVSKDKYIQKSAAGQMQQVKDVIYYKKGKNQFEPEFTPITNNNIITEIDGDDQDMLPLELRKNKINLDITNKSLGNTLKLIMTQLDNVGLVVEPNIDLNKLINMTIKNRNIYDALKDIVEYSGYSLRYNDEKKSLVVSNYINKKYYIPASIFINRNANISFSSQSINPTFDANLKENIADLFLTNIEKIGSNEKIVTLDKQSGIVYVKERSLYIKEIDDFITEFVHSRTQQFNVELAIIQITGSKSNQFGVDLQNILLDAGNISINSLSGGFPLTAAATYNSSTSSTTSSITGGSVIQGSVNGNSVSFDWLLGALDEKGYDNVITKPNVLVQNHSIGYLSNLSTQSYIEKYETTTDDHLNITTPVLGEYQEGLDFYVKLDKFPKKDFVQVSVVPNIKEVTLTQTETNQGIITFPRVEETSTFSVANIKSGDIIVLSGYKKKENSKSSSSPLLSKTPIVGKLFNYETSDSDYTEVVFLIKVTEISKAKDTFKNPSNKSKEIYRNF